MSSGMIIAAILLFFIVYLPATYICYKNVRFPGPARVFFSITIVPVFVGFMIFNIWLSIRYLPFLFDIMDWSEEETANSVESAAQYFLGDEVEGIGGFLISTPIAILLTYIWYRLFKKMANKR